MNLPVQKDDTTSVPCTQRTSLCQNLEYAIIDYPWGHPEVRPLVNVEVLAGR